MRVWVVLSKPPPSGPVASNNPGVHQMKVLLHNVTAVTRAVIPDSPVTSLNHCFPG